uniref:Uncharacterized protein n=1 Tax=Setaria italica TaxID=4555 RepID=K3ZBS6_SETIT
MVLGRSCMCTLCVSKIYHEHACGDILVTSQVGNPRFGQIVSSSREWMNYEKPK